MSAELAVPGDTGGDMEEQLAKLVAELADGAEPAAARPEPAAGAEPLTGVIVPAGDRQQIIPVPLRRENLRGTVEVWAGLQWHRSRFHGIRLPLYIPAVLFWAVVGFFRVIAMQVGWAWLTEQAPLRSDAVIAGDSNAYRRLHKDAQETRRTRLIALAVEAVLLVVGCVLLALVAPWWAKGLACAIALPLLALAGRPDGHRIISPAVLPPQYTEPTPDVISTALGSLGISAINQVIKASPGHNFCITPVMRDGPGWGVQIDLPHGVTAGHIIARRPELASGLRRPLSATWPEGVPAEHEGRLNLWVGFHDLSKQKPVRHPLLRGGVIDIFAGVPFGTDPRQRPVAVPMFEVNWLIGSAPGQGKTNVVRNLAAATAVDPLVEMQIHELAGKGDLEPFAQVCTRYVSGLDDDSVAYAAESARMLRADLERRSKIFGKLPRAVKPEGKLTRELATRYPELRPKVVVFDECQNLFMHPAYGAQAADDLAHVIRLGRAYGIMAELATQRPDKDALPTPIRGIVTARFCLQVPDQDANDMIMGTGAYKAGYNCVLFRPKTDAGLGWLKADGIPQIVRTYKLDLEPSARIAARGRALRERAGTLAGYALGEDATEVMPRDVLADVLAVFGDRTGLQWGDLADRLAGRFPDRWADVTASSLSEQCRSLDVPSVDVRADGQVLKGCRRVGVERAAAAAVAK